MKQTFKEQLAMWRTENGVTTMKEVLEGNTSIVEIDGKKVKVIRPHAFIKTSDIRLLGAYVKYKLEVNRLIERLTDLLNKEEFDKAERTKGGIKKITAKFFDSIREVTGYENVMAINHANALSLEDGEKTLSIHLLPLKADGKSYEFQVLTFNNNDTGESLDLPCITVLNKRKKRSRRKKGNRR